MFRWRALIIFLSILTLCYCQQHHQTIYHVHKKKHKKHHSHFLLYKGLFTYLAFWAIKFKVIFVLGTIFTMFMIGGKLFALIKYTDLLKSKHHEPERIYIQPPEHHDHHAHTFDFAPNIYSGEAFNSYGPSDSGVTLDHPPPGQEYSGNYGRSSSNVFYDNFDMFARMIRKLNITDLALDSMGFKTEECRKKFVCEADYNAKHSSLLQTGFDLLSDESYARYRTNKTLQSIEECVEMYPDCEKNVT